MLLESELIKEHQPKFNRKLRKSRFSYGLYDQKNKDGHDWAARVMVGHGKKIGAKLVSLAHSSFLEDGSLSLSL